MLDCLAEALPSMHLRAFHVREWSKAQISQSNSGNAFRIYVSDQALTSLGLKAGQVCEIQRRSSPAVYALIWASPPGDKINENIVRISPFLRKKFELKYDEPLSIHTCSKAIEEARNVTLKEIQCSDNMVGSIRRMTRVEEAYWTGAVRDWLHKLEVFYSTLTLEDFQYCGETRSFSLHIDSVPTEDLSLYKISYTTTFDLHNRDPNPRFCSTQPTPLLRVLANRVGGLQRQIQRVNKILWWYDEDRWASDDVIRTQLRAGIIFHGLSGTGKSLLLNAVSEAPWARVRRIDHTHVQGKEQHRQDALDRVVQEALDKQPSVIIADNLHTLAPSRDEEDIASSRKTHALCKAFNRTRGHRVLLLAATRDLKDVQTPLMDYFSQTVHLHAPDPSGRREILKLACGLPKDCISELLDKVGDNTHGFSSRDIFRLVETCALDNEHERPPFARFPNPKLQWADIQAVIIACRPSILDSVHLERPQVTWAEVGGNSEVRQVLERAIEWPRKYPERMKRLHVGAIKGVLLYGPPGCSKTLVAKAAAASSTWNFIPVRGPEILRMYVGESERALRNLFQTARAAAPSIIFFDEIDALGLSRSTEGKAGGPQANVLTTLLTELDGIEPLKDVLVLAATNAPESLDPALIRAGRLEQRIYMGLPDECTCRDILLIHKASWAKDVDVDFLAQKALGYTGAEIVRLVEHAGRLALTEGLESGTPESDDKVSMRHFLQALDEVKKDVSQGTLQRYVDFAKRN